MLLGLTLFWGIEPVLAEPVFMPQATSVFKRGQGEIGLHTQYGYQKYELTGLPGTTYITRVWHFPIFARYNVLDRLETRLLIPLTQAEDSSVGAFPSNNKDFGLGNIQAGAKWNLLTGRLPLAVGLDLDFPTANPRNNPGALGWRYNWQGQQGFNGHLYVAMDVPLVIDAVTAHASVGYMKTGSYTTASRSRFSPSDLATLKGAVTFALDPWVKKLSLSAESVVVSAVNKSRTDHIKNGATEGTVIEAGPALRYQYGRVRTHAGLMIDMGKTEFRAYNYRVAFGASLAFGE